MMDKVQYSSFSNDQKQGSYLKLKIDTWWQELLKLARRNGSLESTSGAFPMMTISPKLCEIQRTQEYFLINTTKTHYGQFVLIPAAKGKEYKEVGWMESLWGK